MIEEIINFEKALVVSGEKQQNFIPKGLNILFTTTEIKWGIYPYDKVNFEKIQFSINHLEHCSQLYGYTTGPGFSIGNANCRYDRNVESCNLFSYVLKDQAIENKLANSKWRSEIDKFQQKASVYFDFSDLPNLSLDYLKFISFLKDDNGFLKLRNQILQDIALYNVEEKQKIKFEKFFIFFDVNDNYYREAHDNCLKGITVDRKKQQPNIDFRSQFAESDLLSSFSERKDFLLHKTATFDKDYKIPVNDLTIINSFFTKLKGDTFPKPLPIFIYKEELNRKIVNIFEENKKFTFSDIFENIYSIADEGFESSDLQNYYLLYAQIQNKKLVIKDFEYVPSFVYKINIEIDSVFPTERKLPNKIENIFEFQRIIVREIFDNCLYKRDDKKDIYTNNYWGEVKAQFCKTFNNYRLILQYRKAFYDFIYKSKQQSITAEMIKDIFISGIIDVLKDENYRSKNSAKEERIKTLFNIYFSINSYFDPHNNNFNKIDVSMATKTKELQDYAYELVSDEGKHFNEGEDIQFAFCLGQLVYYLLSQSEASNKTHSLLLAYLQKSDFELLKQKAKEDITKYSYKISFNNKKFNKLSSEVFGYSTEIKFSDISTFFLAGYFSKNIIY